MLCYRSRRDKVLWNHTYGSQQLEMECEMRGYPVQRASLPDEVGGSIPPQAATQTKYEHS